MKSLKTSFVLAEMFSLALGDFYAPENEQTLSQNDPMIISEILDKFSGFINHNNALRRAKPLSPPISPNETSSTSSQETQVTQMSSETRLLAASKQSVSYNQTHKKTFKNVAREDSWNKLAAASSSPCSFTGLDGTTQFNQPCSTTNCKATMTQDPTDNKYKVGCAGGCDDGYFNRIKGIYQSSTQSMNFAYYCDPCLDQNAGKCSQINNDQISANCKDGYPNFYSWTNVSTWTTYKMCAPASCSFFGPEWQRPGFADANKVCQSCDSVETGCLECESATKCKTCRNTFKKSDDGNSCVFCPDGSTVNSQNVCVKCLKGCAKCEDTTSCVTPLDGYYFDTSSNTMKQCYRIKPSVLACKTCTSGSYMSCTVAADGYFTTNNQATKCTSSVLGISCQTCTGTTVATCSASFLGFFINDTPALKKCMKNCAKCSDETSCDTPADGYYFSSTSSSMKPCYTPKFGLISCKRCSGDKSNQCTIPMPGYRLDQFTARACAANCVECSSSGKCIGCARKYLNSAYCNQRCGDYGKYRNDQNQCDFCPTNCLNCFNTDSCETPADGFFFDSTSKYMKRCATLDPLNPLEITCKRCSDAGSGNCLIAMDGFYLADGEIRKCMAGCKTCSNFSTCDSCLPNYKEKLSDSTCEACDAGKVTNYAGNCVKCLTNCIECEDETTCVTPADGFYFDAADSTTPMKKCAVTGCKRCADGSNSCLQALDGFYLESGGNVKKCLKYCLQCEDGNSCKTTADGYLYVNWSQQPNQNTPCYPNNFGGSGASSLTQNWPVTCSRCQNTGKTECIKAMDGFYLDSPTRGEAKQCLKRCLICEDGASCVLAEDGWYYDSTSKLMKRCSNNSWLEVKCRMCTESGTDKCKVAMDGYYIKDSDKSVQKCLQNCAQCVDETTCTTPADGYFLDTSGTPKMSACDSVKPGKITCKTCSDATSTTCSVPMPGYYLASTTVTECDSSCQTCSSAGTCDTCKAAYILKQDNTCEACPTGQQRNSLNICTECLRGCAFCEDSTSCKTPSAGFFFDDYNNQNQMKQCYSLVLGGISCKRCGNSAITSCYETMDGFYLDGWNYQKQCMPSCKSCVDGTSCKVAADGYFLDDSGSSPKMAKCNSVTAGAITCKTCTGSGADACTVPMDGYFLDGTTVTPCDAGCQTCDTTATKCTSCSSKKVFDSAANTCTDCANAGEQVNSAGTCVKCLDNCLVCEDATTCVTPKDGYYFSAADSAMKSCANAAGLQCKRCSGPGNDQCLEAMVGYYIDKSSSTVKRCMANCAACSDGTTCVTPVDGYYYDKYYQKMNGCFTQTAGKVTCKKCIGSGNDQCYEAIDGYYLDQTKVTSEAKACIAGCNSCSDGTTCDTCGDIYKKKDDNTCEKCPAGPPQQKVTSANTCVACLDHCAKCEDSTSCVKNEPGWYFDNSGTTPQMSACYFPYQGFYGCETCTGSGKTHCTKAMDGYYLEGGNTATSCKPSCLTCTDGTSCATCPTGFELGADTRNPNLCAPKPCPYGRYPDAPTASCLECATSVVGKIMCQECTDSGVDKCTKPMPGFYLDSGTAKSCHSSCATCDSATNCLTCIASNKKGADTRNTGICAPGNCPDGKYPDADTQTCKDCDKVNGAIGCKVCTDVGATKCTTAMPGFYLASDNTATKCIPSCATCTTGTSCDTCVKNSNKNNPNTAYFAGLCIPIGCPDSKYGDPYTNTCKDCAKVDGAVGCKKCNNDQADQCLVALPGFYITEDYMDMPAEGQPRRGTATKCATGCLTCADGSGCLTCPKTPVLTKIGTDKRTGKTKYCAPLRCPDGQFIDATSVSGCTDCYQPFENSCKTCSDTGNGKCTSTFDGYYLAGTTVTKCLAQCKSCSDGTTCKTCNPGFSLGADFRYPFLCAPTICPAAEYPDTSDITTPKCSKCTSGCASCRKDQECQTCTQGNKLGLDATKPKLCAPAGCISGQYPDATTVTCKACLSNCVNCTSSSPTTCNKCAAAFYLSPDKSACNSCTNGCATCSGSSACDTCTPGNRIGADVKNPKLCAPISCDDGKYRDAPSVSCKLCSSAIANCVRCTRNDLCGKCADNYQLGQGGTACVACSSTQFFNAPNGKCVDLISCGPGWFNDGTNKCLTCVTNCAQCADKTGKCNRCKPLYQVNATTNQCQYVGPQ